MRKTTPVPWLHLDMVALLGVVVITFDGRGHLGDGVFGRPRFNDKLGLVPSQALCRTKW